jgi:hypothetical protein
VRPLPKPFQRNTTALSGAASLPTTTQQVNTPQQQRRGGASTHPAPPCQTPDMRRIAMHPTHGSRP